MEIMDFFREDFLPIAITAGITIALVAWAVRLGVFFLYRILQRKDKANPHEGKETMGLPKGAMRTFLALSFTSIATLAIFSDASLGIISEVDKKWILAELGGIITFYFGSKSVEAFVDSRAKLAAIERATNFDQIRKILADDREAVAKGEVTDNALRR